MSKMYDAGITTAYGAAVRGGYEGTYEQFCADLGELADVLSEFLGFSVTVETLAEGAEARGEYDAGVLSLGIPRGDTGNGIQSIALNADYTLTVTYTNGQTWTSGSIRGETGATPDLQIGTVSTLSPGSPATAEITGTRDEPRLNLGIPQGVPGEVPAASIAPAYDASSTYAVGEYVMYNNALYRCTTAITTAEAWTAAHWTAAQIGDDLADCSRQLSDKDLFDDIPGTTQTVTFNANDQPASVVYTSGTDTVRSDVFTWGDDTVTEVRTLADGRHVTYVTNLTTLVTTISAIEEAT